MRQVNINEIPEDSWTSPKGKFAGFGKSVSAALGRDEKSTDLRERHPFDLEILRVAPGQTPYVYHSHSAQWEMYHVISGKGVVRHESGTTGIEKGDAFIFMPDEPHQLVNDGTEDLVFLVIADNPIGESGYYPDSKKWLVRSPQRTIIRSESEAGEDYFLGEE
jgi:uncharacterized cupin superfamily protein